MAAICKIRGTVGQRLQQEIEGVSRLEPDFIYTHTIEIRWNKRLRSAAGQCKATTTRGCPYYEIDLNPKYYQEFGLERTIGTLMHEIAHAIDHAKNGTLGHSRWWKYYCQRLGGTMNPRLARDTPSCRSDEYIQTPDKWEYKCPCGAIVRTKRRIGKKKEARGYCMKCKTHISKFTIRRLR